MRAIIAIAAALALGLLAIGVFQLKEPPPLEEVAAFLVRARFAPPAAAPAAEGAAGGATRGEEPGPSTRPERPLETGPSLEAAERLAWKIQAIQDAEEAADRPVDAAESVEASELEMESFVLYWMKDEIPVQVETIDVTLEPGSVAAASQIAFDETPGLGNPLLDLLLRGTHSFYVKGSLTASGGVGRFQLLEVRVDGLPVPLFLVESLVNRYVKPKYPDVDLNAPFQVPWGIEEIEFNPGAVTVTY